MPNWHDLFKDHIAVRRRAIETIMAELKFDTLVIGAGSLQYYTDDDTTVPFRPFHHFAHWVPLEGENHFLRLRAGKKPELLYYQPADFWHEYHPLGSSYWADQFEIKIFDGVDKLWDEAADKGVVYLGPEKHRALEKGMITDVAGLKEWLNWDRSYKTDYEIACTEEATRRAANGHKAAESCFRSGGSELDIHYAFLTASECLERELAYETIVCLNEKGAILHYHNKRPEPRNGKVLLIDAGCRYRHYNSDITRTYVTNQALPEFKEMVDDLNTEQQVICRNIRAGKTMADLHDESCLAVGRILLKHGVLKGCDEEFAVKEGFVRAFYPHGVGHMLGIFVHDLGGQQEDRRGTPAKASAKHPKIRTTRTLEAGHLFTVEPGIYFIDMLLKPFRDGEHKDYFDWQKIEALMPHGGIRIEDDIFLSPQGPRNLTRPYLP